jgi:glycosyltransferase involved in cell wall biosynthesis
MRVLWFTNCLMPAATAHLSLPSGVRGHWMSELLSALRQQTHLELGVITALPAVPTSRFSAEGIDYFVIGQPRFQSIFTYSPEHLNACVRIVEEFRPDIIHVHGSERFYGLMGARSLVRPPVLISIQGLLRPCAAEFFGALDFRDLWRAESLHEALTYRGLLWNFHKLSAGVKQEAEILRGATAVAGRTQWDQAWCRALAPQARYLHIDEVLRPAFSQRSWSPASCDEHSIIFTNVGTPTRGTEVLLSAVQMLKSDFPDIRLRLGGSSGRRFGRQSSYDRFLRTRVAELGLSDMVEWLGELDADAMADALLRSHVFAICSYVENSSNSLCEAMNLGVPCVASYAGGIPSLLEEERTGLFFPKGDAAQLAANIYRLFTDEGLCVRLGAAAARTARVRHAPERVVAQTLDAYHSLTGQQEIPRALAEEAQGVA